MRRLTPLALLLLGFSPFQAEHPEVERGNRALSAGDPAAALRHYDQAQEQLGSRAEIDYDRGNALYRQQRFEEAREAYKKALAGPEGLKSREYYNLGNALAHLKADEEALEAYRKALATDPRNEDARYNLEVMLRRKQVRQKDAPKDQKQQKPQQEPPDGGAGQSGERDGGADAGRDGGREQERDAGADPRDGGSRQDQGREDALDGGKKQADSPRDRPDGGSASREAPKDPKQEQGGRPDQRPPQVSRQEAERLLDAMRARERQMPITPVRPRRPRSSSNAEKDW